MDDDIHAVHRADEPLAVADVANEIAQGRMVEFAHLHFVLFQLVAAEDDDLLRLFLGKQRLCELLAEGSCPTCDEDDLIFPVHDFSYMSLRVFEKQSPVIK